MPRRGSPPLEADLLQGTLDLLILKTVAIGPAHGHTIAHVIEHQSEDVLHQELGEADVPALRRAILANLPDDPKYPGLQAYWADK